MAFSIVVVDGDVGSGQITQAGIQRSYGIEATVSLMTNPDWSVFHTQQPDAVVFDPAGQSGGGVRVVQRMHEELPKTHIMVLASAPSSVLRATMTMLGVDAYLEKPTPVSMVVEKLRQMLQHPSLSESAL